MTGFSKQRPRFKDHPFISKFCRPFDQPGYQRRTYTSSLKFRSYEYSFQFHCRFIVSPDCSASGRSSIMVYHDGFMNLIQLVVLMILVPLNHSADTPVQIFIKQPAVFYKIRICAVAPDVNKFIHIHRYPLPAIICSFKRIKAFSVA